MVSSNLKNFMCIALLLITNFVFLPSAMASETFPCDGGTFKVDPKGAVGGLSDCKGALVFPESAISFAIGAFIPEAVTSISVPAGFRNITGLVDSTTSIALQNFFVNANNPYAASVDGVLYSKDLTKLLRMPMGRTGSYKVLPDTKTVDQKAFMSSKLTNIDLGTSVETLEIFSLYSATNLESITFSPAMKTINDDALVLTEKLNKIVVPANNPNFVFQDGNLLSKDLQTLYLYPMAKTDKTCIVPAKVKTLKRGALNYLSCKSVSLPDSLTTIEASVFFNSAVTKLAIPSTIQEISPVAFYGAESLSELTISGNSSAFSSVNGVLYNKDQTTLIAYPEGKPETTYELPATVKDGVAYLARALALTSIDADPANPQFKDVDGVLYDFTGEELWAYPRARLSSFYVIPNGVRRIKEGSIINPTLKVLMTLENPQLIDATDIDLTIYDNETGLKQISANDIEYRTAKEELVTSLESTIAERDTTISTLQADKKSAQDALAKSQAETKTAKDSLTKAQADLKITQDAKSASDATLKTTQDALAKAQADLKSAQDALAKALASSNTQPDALAKAQSDLKSAQDGLAKSQTDLKAAQDAKSASDLAAKTAQDALAKALADTKAAQDALTKALADTKAATDAKAISDAALKANQESQAKALADAKAAADSAIKAAQDAKAESDAKIKVLQDAKSAADAQIAQLTADLAAANAELKKWKPTTITCIKGSSKKTVTAVNPKCPTGYKQK